MMCESPLFLNRFSVLYVFVGLVLLVGFFSYFEKKCFAAEYVDSLYAETEMTVP